MIDKGWALPGRENSVRLSPMEPLWVTTAFPYLLLLLHSLSGGEGTVPCQAPLHECSSQDFQRH